MLKVSNLRVNYGAVTALQDVSLNVKRSSITFVVGPNGAGKSTLLLAIAGVLAAPVGDIELDGKSMVGRPPEEIARLGCSLVPEGRQVFTGLTVAENLHLGRLIGTHRSGAMDL